LARASRRRLQSCRSRARASRRLRSGEVSNAELSFGAQSCPVSPLAPD
jgi:hypothetical protein